MKELPSGSRDPPIYTYRRTIDARPAETAATATVTREERKFDILHRGPEGAMAGGGDVVHSLKRVQTTLSEIQLLPENS